jgi:hypothetical protein
MRINENEFLLGIKYLSMKGVFSVENRILDSVGMSLTEVGTLTGPTKDMTAGLYVCR